MRPRILRALLGKELRRLGANRGAIGMLLLLVVASALLSAFGAQSLRQAAAGGDSARCRIDYWRDSPWVEHLRANRPTEVELRSMENKRGLIRYPPNTVGIQVRSSDDTGERYTVWIWRPAEQHVAGWCEAWFWEETNRFHQNELRAHSSELSATPLAPDITVRHSSLRGGLDVTPRVAIAMGLSLLSLLFVGVFLLPSMTAEERERGVVLAIALSPASLLEIALAKIGFYFLLATLAAAVVAGIAVPSALAGLYFWLAVACVALGAVGIGLTVASLARTQRAASTGAVLYLFASGIVLLTLRGSPLEPLTWVMLEGNGPQMLLAALSGHAAWGLLFITAPIAVGWSVLGALTFRYRGWR